MKKPRKTTRAVYPNKGVEAAYRKALTKLIDDMANSFEYWIGAAYKSNPPSMAQDASPAIELSKKLSEIARRWIKRFDDMAANIAARFARSGQKHTDASFKSALKDAGWTVDFKITPEMRDAMNATIKENISLIKSIPRQYALEVEGIVMRGFTAGRDLQYISEELSGRYGVSKRRAALIARDQSNKLTATTLQARRLELGLFEAEWVHSAAGKDPRQSHQKAGRERKRFDVRKGAYIDGEYILPGQLINCRCSSKTILPF